MKYKYPCSFEINLTLEDKDVEHLLSLLDEYPLKPVMYFTFPEPQSFPGCHSPD